MSSYIPLTNQTSQTVYINYQITSGTEVSTSIPANGTWTPPADTVVVHIVDAPDD